MLSERLKALREQAGLSQNAFARTFGVAQSTVAGWESGAREPNIATIRHLADFFGVTVDYLLPKRKISADDRDADHHVFKYLSVSERADIPAGVMAGLEQSDAADGLGHQL